VYILAIISIKITTLDNLIKPRNINRLNYVGRFKNLLYLVRYKEAV